ncbi:NAD(P)/FAD-dependent oxidoreductase [Rhizobium sp. 18055]|uniref:NAD(P)/FAD-dependent oxidoreductase n=1 Tax=Rhizobium sp. 18055 TaxID=2681403 RepID=UPI00135B197A|nr:FAD-dependent oxidoreductase [Rhizobium sp. 18055]
MPYLRSDPSERFPRSDFTKEKMMSERRKIAVVGAGIAGLALARSLHDIADVTVFEKSRGVGGRMATRRAGAGGFDHGAQYFTVRDDAFRRMLEPAIEEGIVQAWTGTIGSCSRTSPGIRHEAVLSPRFVGTPGMTGLPKWLSRGLDVRLATKVDAIEGVPCRWEIAVGSERIGPFDWVVTACPAPQALALLPASFSRREPIANANMNACFTLMITLEYPALSDHCALRYDDEIISFVADNSSKPQRSAQPSLVVHCQNTWADRNIGSDLDAVRSAMLGNLAKLMPGIASNIAAVEIHRWRFANVDVASADDVLIDVDSRLAACGDWTIGNRVEAAFLSARKLSQALGASL